MCVEQTTQQQRQHTHAPQQAARTSTQQKGERRGRCARDNAASEHEALRCGAGRRGTRHSTTPRALRCGTAGRGNDAWGWASTHDTTACLAQQAKGSDEMRGEGAARREKERRERECWNFCEGLMRGSIYSFSLPCGLGYGSLSWAYFRAQFIKLLASFVGFDHGKSTGL